jgi:Neuraminidase (sialidase)
VNEISKKEKVSENVVKDKIVEETENESITDIDQGDKIGDSDNMLETGISWEGEAITVYKPYSGGVWYPRMYKLKNGTILCGFDTNEDGGRAVIKIVSSEDGGLTWSKTAIQGTNNTEYDCANANFIELDNGELWLAYRANVMDGEAYYSSIRVNVSKDGGKTWEQHSVVTEEKASCII